MQPANLHLTLAFIGAIDVAHREAIARALAALRPLAAPLRLDHLGSFARARVAWAGVAPDDDLVRLAADVRTALDALGARYDPGPFVPHVTLVRDFRAALPGAFGQPVTWPAGPPLLVLSTRDGNGRVRYRPWLAHREPSPASDPPQVHQDHPP